MFSCGLTNWFSGIWIRERTDRRTDGRTNEFCDHEHSVICCIVANKITHNEGCNVSTSVLHVLISGRTCRIHSIDSLYVGLIYNPKCIEGLHANTAQNDWRDNRRLQVAMQFAIPPFLVVSQKVSLYDVGFSLFVHRSWWLPLLFAQMHEQSHH